MILRFKSLVYSLDDYVHFLLFGLHVDTGIVVRLVSLSDIAVPSRASFMANVIQAEIVEHHALPVGFQELPR